MVNSSLIAVQKTRLVHHLSYFSILDLVYETEVLSCIFSRTQFSIFTSWPLKSYIIQIPTVYIIMHCLIPEGYLWNSIHAD